MAYAINESGQVLAYRCAEGQGELILWKGGVSTVIAPREIAVRDSVWADLNDEGVILVDIWSDDGTEWGRATPHLIHTDGSVEQLFSSDASVPSARIYGRALNNKRQVVGSISSGIGDFIWSPDGGVRLLPSLTGRADTMSVQGLDEKGRAVGSSRDAQGADRATLWDEHGAPHVLSAGGLSGDSSARLINEEGEIAGEIGDRATFWTSSGQPYRLYEGFSDVHDLNDDGWVGGSIGVVLKGAVVWKGDAHAVLGQFLPEGSPYHLTVVTGINNSLQVVGHGLEDDRYPMTFFMQLEVF